MGRQEGLHLVADGKIKDDRSLYSDGPADALHKADDLNDHKREEQGEQKTAQAVVPAPGQVPVYLPAQGVPDVGQQVASECSRTGRRYQPETALPHQPVNKDKEREVDSQAEEEPGGRSRAVAGFR